MRITSKIINKGLLGFFNLILFIPFNPSYSEEVSNLNLNEPQLHELTNKLNDNKAEIKNIFITNLVYSFQHYYNHCQHKVFRQ